MAVLEKLALPTPVLVEQVTTDTRSLNLMHLRGSVQLLVQTTLVNCFYVYQHIVMNKSFEFTNYLLISICDTV